MSKEWLKAIDENKIMNIDGITDELQSIEITPEDYANLVGQAEQVEGLIKSGVFFETGYHQFDKENDRLRAENKRYREGLENIVNVDGYFYDRPFDVVKALNLIDEEVRKALEGDSDE